MMLLLDILELIGEFAGALVSVFPGRYKHGVTPVILESALLHPVVTLILMNLLAATLRPDPTAVSGPSAFHQFLGIEIRLARINDIVVLVVIRRRPTVVLVVALLLVRELPPPRHTHHAAASPELTLYHFVGIAVVIAIDSRGRDTLADVVYTSIPVLVDAKALVDATSPRHRSNLAPYHGVRALHQIVVTMPQIGRQVFLLQMRSKLTSEIAISVERVKFNVDGEVHTQVPRREQ